MIPDSWYSITSPSRGSGVFYTSNIFCSWPHNWRNDLLHPLHRVQMVQETLVGGTSVVFLWKSLTVLLVFRWFSPHQGREGTATPEGPQCCRSTNRLKVLQPNDAAIYTIYCDMKFIFVVSYTFTWLWEFWSLVLRLLDGDVTYCIVLYLLIKHLCRGFIICESFPFSLRLPYFWIPAESNTNTWSCTAT